MTAHARSWSRDLPTQIHETPEPGATTTAARAIHPTCGGPSFNNINVPPFGDFVYMPTLRIGEHDRGVTLTNTKIQVSIASSFKTLCGATSTETGALGYTALGRLSYSVTWSLGYNGSTPEERGVSMGRPRGPSSPANGACASAGRSSQAESDPEPAVIRPTGRGVNKIGCTSVSTVRVPTRGSPANHRRRSKESAASRGGPYKRKRLRCDIMLR